MEDLFLLVDGNSLINRAYFALPPLSTEDGVPSQAVYGFCTMLIRAIGEYKPTRLAVAFDLPGPTFRHAEYKEYKATRKGMPEDLAIQLPMLKRLLAEMGIKTVETEGYEADDVIGTLSDCKHPTIIITGDKDALQLIDGCTRVAYTKKGISGVVLYDQAAFRDEYGFDNSCFVDFKALFGDSSDNIPGVSGIGEKTASALIKEYGSLEKIYQNLIVITPNTAQKLISGKESAFLSRHLAQIERRVPLSLTADDCAFSMPFPASVKNSFIRYNFKSLAGRGELFHNPNAMPPESAPAKNSAPERIEVKDAAGLAAAVKDISRAARAEGFFAILIDENDCIGLAAQKAHYGIKLKTNLLDYGMEYGEAFKAIIPLLADDAVKKIVFDLKAFRKSFPGGTNIKNGTDRTDGIDIKNCFDIKLAAYLTDFDSRPDDIAGLCTSYGCNPEYGAYALLSAFSDQQAKLKELGLERLYYDTELPLAEILFRMEQWGFGLDLDLCGRLGVEFDAKLKIISAEIYTDCGHEFNLNSPKQLGVVLFDELKIPYPKKNKNYSTAFEILDPLRHKYPIVEKVLGYRQISKLSGTYVEGLKKLAGSDGRIHTDFKQTMTATGRLSSAEPNLQNIPIREDVGKKLRGMFVAAHGYTLVSADYSQIELRLLAHFSGDPVMREAFVNREDIHAQTAAKVFGVNLNEVTPQMRQNAKAVNFGIVYGISDFGLAESLRIPVIKAAELIERYFERFKGVKEYLEDCIKTAKENGFSQTLLGRIRRIPELKSPNHQVRKFGERVAMNTPMQGSAADIIKAAMITADRKLSKIGARLILQVHDELIAEAPDAQTEYAKEILRDCMENAIALSVPLEVSVGSGKRWLDCK